VTDGLDEERPALTRGKVVRLIIAACVMAATTAGWMYVRYFMPKAPLGGPCQWGVQCDKEAPLCLRESLDGEGTCSRSCDAGTDCAPGIKCVDADLNERDDEGKPLRGGYCFPEAFVERQKKRPRR
jgi:hypothetical protein